MNLPIAERELRVYARSPRTYFGRLIACVIFGVITAWLFWFSTKIGRFNAVAAQTYAFISQVALMMCIFSANATADVLSSEKRNGTLGLLFLTDLKGHDIVFGKLAAVGLLSFYSLLGIIPILSMPVLMGGITGQTIFRTAITLLNGLFFGLAVGLWVSSRSWEQKRATNTVVWISVIFLWGFPALSALARYRFHSAQIADFIYMLSPMYQQDHANPFGIGMLNDKYWRSVAFTHALGWLALWSASRRLPCTWQDRVVTHERGRFKRFLHELRFGSGDVRVAFRRRLLDINAIHWLSSREKSAPIWSWVFILICLLGWIGLWLWFHFVISNGPPFWGVGIPSVFAMILGLRMRSVALAGEVIARDRFSGALELLLSTTLTERDVIRGQWLTIRRTVAGPALASIIIGTVVFVNLLEPLSSDRRHTAWLFYFGMLTVYVTDLITSVWAGMWAACTSKTVAGAPGKALVRILLLPWVLFVGFATLASLFNIGNQLDFIGVFYIWWTVCMVSNIVWIKRSRRNIYQHLRAKAAERYQPPPPHRRWWMPALFSRRPSPATIPA